MTPFRNKSTLAPVLTLYSAVVGLLPSVAAPPEIRVATYNMLLSPASHAALTSTLANPSSSQPRRIAEIVQRVAPDILFINELNYDGTTSALDALHDNFFAVSQNGQPAQVYPHRYVAESNTGEHSGFDFNNDFVIWTTPGSELYGDDCYGYGEFPGRYAMAVMSKYPIVIEDIRTMRLFLWKDMPGALLPVITGNPAGATSFYSTDELGVFRLSSKSHWDIPIEVDGHVVHLLGSHPTPPTFDGPIDENGRRNHDEIRLWADYIDPAKSAYVYDDDGVFGGLGAGERFVIAGDENADPVNGESVNNAILQLLDHPLVDSSVAPMSAGGGGTNTATFGLRVDYVLPSKAGFGVLGGAVFWPAPGQPGRSLVSASDHRLVYMDLRLEPLIADAVQGLTFDSDGDDLVMSWAIQDGVSYQVETSETLQQGDWSEVMGLSIDVVDGQASTRIAEALSLGDLTQFYRVAAQFD